MMKVVEKMLEWENAGKTKLLSVGYSLRPPELLFRKIEDEEIDFQIQKLKGKTKNVDTVPANEAGPAARQPAHRPLKEEIQYDDFARLDIRVGTIKKAEKVPKADKLLQLEVDLGSETRTILSGIAQHFAPESLVNRQVMVVANLAPRKMRGIESQGMILTAEDRDGKLYLVGPENAVYNGANVS